MRQAAETHCCFLLVNRICRRYENIIDRKSIYPLTTGDSSLSASIQAIIAFELGYLRKAMEYARYAALMDLADVGGNVKDGCHIASMGGTWMAIVYGAAGMRDHDGVLTFLTDKIDAETILVELYDQGRRPAIQASLVVPLDQAEGLTGKLAPPPTVQPEQRARWIFDQIHLSSRAK